MRLSLDELPDTLSRATASVSSIEEPWLSCWLLVLGRAYGAERWSRFFLGGGMDALLVSGLVLVEAPELPGVETDWGCRCTRYGEVPIDGRREMWAWALGRVASFVCQLGILRSPLRGWPWHCTFVNSP